MAGISLTGVGSGLDLAGLLDQLVAAERAAPSLRYDRAQGRAQTQLSALGSLKSALAELRTATDALEALGAFSRRTAVSSDATLFTATADSTALPSAYQVEVQSLAAAHKLASGAFASAGAVVGDGTLTLETGGASFSVVLAAGSTLAQVRDAINGAADNAGVRASIVTADDGAHLVLTAASGGTANALRVTRSGGDGGLDALVYDPGVLENLAVKQAAADAVVVVDGFTHTGSGNAVAGVIGGVTLQLARAAPGAPATLTVGNDAAAVKAALETFVTAYNKVVSTVRAVTHYNPDTRAAAPLAGDALPRGLSATLRGLLGGAVAGLPDALNALSDIGVTTARDGSLSIDATRFDAALAADFAGVQALFTSGGGLATRLDAALGGYLGASGAIAARQTTLNAELDRIADGRERLERRLEAMETRLRTQFAALDALVAQMNSTSQFLGQQIAGWNASR
jgi:flagellar hook-associated protein 2